MAPRVGFEPTAKCLTGTRSATELPRNGSVERLRTPTPYGTKLTVWHVSQFHHDRMEPGRRIELRLLVYHTSVLPLNYTDIGTPGETRTRNLADYVLSVACMPFHHRSMIDIIGAPTKTRTPIYDLGNRRSIL